MMSDAKEMAVPATRDLSKLIEACQTVESELHFQMDRLDTMVQARTPEEADFHVRLRKGYAEAHRFVGILRKYQAGRLARQQAGVEEVAGGGIDELGRAGAFLDEEP